MRSFYLILFLFLPLAPLMAQESEDKADPPTEFTGMVAYAETQKFELNLPPEMERMRERLNDTRNASVVVIFNESASISQLAPEKEVVEPKRAPNDRRGRQWNAFRGRDENVTFVDFDKEEAIQKKEFLDRTFLIEGAAKPQWKLKDEVSEFLGYMCHRAEAMVDSSLVEAWFTMEIPVPAGPDDFYGLPGLILIVTTDDGNHSYVATGVSLRAVNDDIIVAPTEGKEMDREDYEKMVKEKTEERRKAFRRRGRRGR